jgi:Protein of unknown function (DUF1631)
MTPTEPRLQAALDAATHHIQATLTAVAARVSEQLGAQAASNGKVAERDLMIATQFDLRRNASALNRVFGESLHERIRQELSPAESTKRTLSSADWQTLSLVDDTEMEERMFSDRIGQQISHACESELRELAGYMGSLLLLGRADHERNPLRAEVVGAALYKAIEVVSTLPEPRKMLARELGAAMAKAMPETYSKILHGLQTRGVQPVSLSVRQVEGPGNQLPGVNSGYQSLATSRSQSGDLDGGASESGTDTGHLQHRTQRGGFAGSSGNSSSGNSSSGARTGYGPASGERGGSTRAGLNSRSGVAASQADVQLMALLRRLTAIASRPGDFDATPRGSQSAAGSLGGGYSGGHSGGRSSSNGAINGGENQPLNAEGLTGLMAVNLIRAHREELMQASGGKLDHMVIDVVGSLFDQILSDTRVPPQMARQIARLQLPVLRVALNDATFFSSRRHPVRRFVNRIASLACAFDDFDEGPGKLFLHRVRDLVQEIVEGDFDQIEIYAAKLAQLEAFISEQTQSEVDSKGAVSTLGSKETELRLQQRYMLQLQAALNPLQLPDYLRDFLPQVWSQALVLAVSREGAQSDRATRYRRVGRDLVMSVQPKGSPLMRKKFLMQLPPLMKDLNEGLALIGWPATAQRDFFAKLMPAHAESLKLPALSELDHNLMAKQLEGIFATPVPGSETLSPHDPVPEVEPDVIERQFTPEEVKKVGLVTESAVDWSGTIDIDLGDESGTGTDTAGAPIEPADESTSMSLSGIDIDLGSNQGENAEPTRGPQLMDHIKLGFAYQMHMKDEWQKVRLAHVSAGRSFFVFTRGKKHQETISMTARMLARMCETGRLRAVESAYLMERATQRARKQLARLKAPTRS